MFGFIIAATILAWLMWRWHDTQRSHEKRIDSTRWRIHVNGIRGKSTVVRLVAGVLREGGFHTVGKTTGSAARIIFEDGNEAPILRKGAPTIVEQIDIIRMHTTETTEALVIECMAVSPIYQRVAQDQIVKGNIGVITNVREDHQDVMGETLEEIADALSNTIPYDGILIVAEDRPHLRKRLAAHAQRRNTEILYADPAWVTNEDLKQFKYLSFRENLAVGLTLARMLNIPREVAMRGMLKALPDVGSIFVQQAVVAEKEIIWAPLFAVNDRESAIIGVESLRRYQQPSATRIGILNNRYDRAVRAMRFADIAAKDIQLDYYITFGAYERQVTKRMVECGYPRERIFNLGFSRNPTLAEILDQIVEIIDGDQGLLVGLGNIHTTQAELLMEFFHHLKAEQRQAGSLTADLAHVPESVQRRRYLIRHLLRQRERNVI